MIDVKQVADAADIIVDGYAFTKEFNIVRILNLNNPRKALVFDNNGVVIETDMDDIEISIVKKYYERNKKYLKENSDA